MVIFVSINEYFLMRIPAVLLLGLLSYSAVAQKQAQPAATKQVQLSMSKEEMMAKRKEIQDAISETERQLEDLKKDKKATMGELRALQNKLADRQRLIENINDEMEDIDKTIKSSSKEVDNLKDKLGQLKIRYAQSIRYSYETRSSYDMLAFLFSSRDFNDAMRRMKYLKKFRDYRKQQVDQIRSTQEQLQHKITTLSSQKKQKDELLSTQEQQKQVLQKETNETNAVMEELKGKESELMKSIEKNRAMAKRVDHYIQMVIEREIAKAAEEQRKKEAEERKKEADARKAELAKNNTNAPANVEHPLASSESPRNKINKVEAPVLLSTPTDVALASNLEGNKGRLPWPVDRGYITDHFGKHPHPIEHHVMIDNPGVDIQTSAGATVKAVFEGVVTSVSTVDNMVVMIKVADYFMVYNNLQSVSVKVGQHVGTSQPIGVVADNDRGEPTINFQIWKAGARKGSTKLNPELWLGKAR